MTITVLVLLALAVLVLRARHQRANPACAVCGHRFSRDDNRIARYWLSPLNRQWLCLWCWGGGYDA
jgi:hypothetical protein